MIDEPVRGGFPDPSFGSLPGIERARAVLRGLTPRAPLSHLTGITLTQVGPGSATATMPASPWLVVDHPKGTVQLLPLIDTALRMAALTGAGPGMEVSTATLTTSYLRPPTLDSGGFVARARVVNSGRTYTLADAVVEDTAGRAVAQSTASVLVRPIVPPPPPAPETLRPVPQPTYPTPDPYLRPDPDRVVEQEYRSLDWLRRIIAGDEPLPPGVRLFGIRFVEVDEGSSADTLTAGEWLCGLDRTVSPGVVGYLAHVALNKAAASLAPAGWVPASLSVHCTFVRPVAPDGRELLARGQVVLHVGDLVVSAVEVTDADGNPVAVGQQSAILRPTRASTPGPAEHERALLTVLFTDVVGSTEAAQRLGDARWTQLLDEHHAVVRREIGLFKGREVKTTGDGFLATFESPGRAVQCARAVRDGLRRHGLEVRAGLHTGECELSGDDVAGIAVHIAARIESLASAGEILVSGTVRDLVAGSGLRFANRGRHPLKGIEGDWAVFALES